MITFPKSLSLNIINDFFPFFLNTFDFIRLFLKLLKIDILQSTTFIAKILWISVLVDDRKSILFIKTKFHLIVWFMKKLFTFVLYVWWVEHSIVYFRYFLK